VVAEPISDRESRPISVRGMITWTQPTGKEPGLEPGAAGGESESSAENSTGSIIPTVGSLAGPLALVLAKHITSTIRKVSRTRITCGVRRKKKRGIESERKQKTLSTRQPFLVTGHKGPLTRPALIPCENIEISGGASGGAKNWMRNSHTDAQSVHENYRGKRGHSLFSGGVAPYGGPVWEPESA